MTLGTNYDNPWRRRRGFKLHHGNRRGRAMDRALGIHDITVALAMFARKRWRRRG